MVGDAVSSYRHSERSEKSLSFAVRDSRFPHMCRAVPLSSAVFHPACALSAPSGHLPLEGKAALRGKPASKSPSGIATIYTPRHFCFLCAAAPFLIPHSRKAFIHNQWTEPPKGLTLNHSQNFKRILEISISPTYTSFLVYQKKAIKNRACALFLILRICRNVC